MSEEELKILEGALSSAVWALVRHASPEEQRALEGIHFTIRRVNGKIDTVKARLVPVSSQPMG